MKLNNDLPLEMKLSEEVIFNIPDSETLALLDDSDTSSRESNGDGGKIYLNSERKSRSVYVKNVEYDTNPKELEEHFKDCGEISRITIFVDKYTGMAKG
jgi:RNA recognition motif-containing protein